MFSNKNKSSGGLFSGGNKSGGGGLFSGNNNSGGGGGLFSGGNKSSNSGGGGLFSGGNSSGGGGGGLFSGGGGGGLFSGGNKSGGGGLFSGGSSSGGGGLFGSSSNNNTNTFGGGNNNNLIPQEFYTGPGLDQNAASAAGLGRSFNFLNSNNNSSFMNAYQLLSRGYSKSNAYTMTSNDFLYKKSKDGSDRIGSKELEKEARIARFKFLTQKSRNWMFKLHSNNRLNKKKVANLPQNYQKQILWLDKELKKNKKILTQISESSDKLKKTINEKMKDLIEENILSIRLINIELCKVGSQLKEVTELMKYYESICTQIKRYCESTRSDNSPIYNIPSNNAKMVMSMMKEKLKTANSTIDELTLMLLNDKDHSVPEDPMRIYSGIIEQIYNYLLIILKKAEQLESDVLRLVRRTNILPKDSQQGHGRRRGQESSNRNEIASKLDTIERML